MSQENKITVVAPIDVQQYVEAAAQEKAAILAFPDEKQNDLQYIRSILVSAGTNKNGAHFLPSEMMKAHNTIVHKAIDIEHDESRVIGHIYDCAFTFKDGELFDPKKLQAESLGYDPNDLIGGFVKVVAGTKALGKHLVGRVLRGITFSGMGIVKNPANPHFIILETAAHKEQMEKNVKVIDLEQIDNLRGYKVELHSKASEEKVTEEVATSTEMADNLVQVTPVLEDGTQVSGIYVELDKETGGLKRVLTMGDKEERSEEHTSELQSPWHLVC